MKPLTVQNLEGTVLPGPTIDDNMKLAHAAVAYAKQKAPRSNNQWYFKTLHPLKEKERANVLMSLVRVGHNDPARIQMATKVRDIVFHPTLSRSEKNRQLDAIIEKLKRLPPKVTNNEVEPSGANYFNWGYDKRTDLEQRIAHLSNEEQATWQVTETAKWAREGGAGNCREKSALTIEYLYQNAPKGLRIAWVALEYGHLGVTGRLAEAFGKNGGGDHAFCVIGHASPLTVRGATTVAAWGRDAIIIDGWMNDAYPARHHLQWKYGYTYKNERINLKQLNVRNIICVSYRNHLVVQGDWIA